MNYSAFVILVSVCLVFSSVKAADSGGGTVGVGGESPPICAFQAAPQQLSASNMSLTGADINSGQINVEQLVDESTAHLNTASIQIEILGVCNQAHYFSLLTTRGGLVPEDQIAVAGGTFTQHINYRAEVTWAGKSAVLETDATPGKKITAPIIDGPNSGPLNLNIIIDATTNDMNLPTVFGVYSDSLIVQIGQPL